MAYTKKQVERLDQIAEQLKTENIIFDWRNDLVTDKEGKQWRTPRTNMEMIFAFQDGVPVFTLFDKIVFIPADWTADYMPGDKLEYKAKCGTCPHRGKRICPHPHTSQKDSPRCLPFEIEEKRNLYRKK